MERSWPELRESTSLQLDALSYAKEAVLTKEDVNWELFLKHSDKVIPFFKGHQEVFEHTFGKGYRGVGVLDVGTGNGVFLENYLTQSFLPPRIGADIAQHEVPERGWLSVSLNANDILEYFGENSFDHVQCIETLEHVGDAAIDIAAQMLKVARKTCLITCMGIDHHLGDLNKEAVTRNPFLDYKGQPNIEALMDLGYQVRLVGNYQVLAWHIK